MHKRLFLPTLTAVLFMLLVIVALLCQRFIDAEQLAQSATAPYYTGATEETQPSETQETIPSQLTELPALTVYDRNGNPVSLTDFIGTPIVLNFWTSWSNACKTELPIIQSYFEAHGEDVLFLMINATDGTKETQESAEEFWDSLNTDMTAYYDLDAEAVDTFLVTTAPTTYFIDAQGKIVFSTEKRMSSDTLERGIRTAMAETP